MSHLDDAVLDAYAEGMLSTAERAAADAHLAACADCRMTLVSLAQVGDLLRAQPRQAPPPQLIATIVNHLAPMPAPRLKAGWTRGRWVLASLAAMAVWSLLVVLVGETVLAAYRRGLGEFARLAREHPELVMRYPSDALYAFLESLPLVEIGLTLVLLIAGLWLVQRLIAALPQERHA